VLGTGLLKAETSASWSGSSTRRKTSGATSGFLDLLHGASIPAPSSGRSSRAIWAQDVQLPGAPDVVGYGPELIVALGIRRAAGVGMTLGLVQYRARWTASLGTAGPPSPPNRPRPRAAAADSGNRRFSDSAAGLLVAGAALASGLLLGFLPITIKQVTGRLTATFCSLWSCSFLRLAVLRPGAGRQRRRNGCISSASSSSRRRCSGRYFEQAGSTLNLFCPSAARTIVLPGYGCVFPAVGGSPVKPRCLIIVFAPIFAWLWLKLRRQPGRRAPTKFAFRADRRRPRILDSGSGRPRPRQRASRSACSGCSLCILLHTPSPNSSASVRLA